MSGTSLDGADAILVDWDSRHTLGFVSRPYSPGLRQALLRLCSTGPNEIDLAGEVACELARVYAAAVDAVLRDANIRAGEVRSIACHGQTIRHRPDRGFTIQLQNAALLVELTGISVVADFRSRDVAAGGQGAPLAPVFHEMLFMHPNVPRVIINIGGISNLSRLRPGLPVTGFDCGPGNVLMDFWVDRFQGVAYDDRGEWARTGRINDALLTAFLSDPYFDAAPPKSTGRELFNADWLLQHVSAGDFPPQDVQATLLELTCRCISDAIHSHCLECKELIVCGGGARNDALMDRLRTLSGRSVQSSDALGIPAGHVEALGFSWLGKRALEAIPTSLQSVTGSGRAVVLGAIYAA